MKYFTVCLFLACAIGTYAESVPYIVDCSIIRCQEGQVCEMRAAEDCTKNCQLLPICVAKSIPDVVASSNSTDCPVNEEFLKCGTACEPSCSDKDDGPKICTKQCVVDVCQCKEGFVRNAHKQCVKRKQCGFVTPICPVNEEFRKCGSACEPKCSDKPTEGPKMCTMNCIDNVCQCKVGFVRNDEGNCVRKADCDAGSVTPICPVNEEFRECGSACEPKCSDKDTEGPKMCTMNCIDNACQCKVGFVRNADGKCVRKADCDAASNSTDCPVNEEFLKCGTACEPNCSDKKDGPKICTKQCIVDVCQCKKGFVRNAHKQCVRRKQCGSVTPICPKNEEFRECGSACEPKCSDEPTEGPKMCTMNCIDNVCQCKVGFVRNEKGNCVRKADCDSEPVATCETLKCPENMKCEVPTFNCFTTPCPQPPAECVSSDPKLSCQDVKCPPNYFCIQAMRMCLGNEPCEPQTPPKCVPKEEEKYNPCAAHSCLVGQICQPKKVQCVSPPCKPVAECVPQNQTSQCPENEVFNACGGCENTCENKNMICPAVCRPGKCVCGLGFYRHNEVCVKESECTAEEVHPCATVKCSAGQECREVEVRCFVPPCKNVGQCFNISDEKCGENEKFNSCGACDGTCENPNTICPAICRFPGSCGCIPGYVRSNGKCIAQKDCPAPKCKDNEELKKCGTACEPSCTNPNPICPKQCVVNVCQCKEGLVRNDNGDCVKEEGCKKECGVNQQFLQCGTACEPTCTNPRPTCTRQCVPNVCQCERGFMRDQSGNCVSLKQCAQTTSVCAKTKCAADEICQLKDVQCVKEPCDPVAECVKATVTCANVRIICKPGTECGMVDGKPTCVPIKCSDDEELKTCGTACEPSCQNPNPICTKQCVANVCQCKEGLVRNDNGKCVKEEGCKKECGVNQQFLQCGTACEPTCTNPRPTCTRQCVPNVCQCERGFMRDQNGNCVSLKQCAQTTSVCARTKCAADEICQLKDVQCVKEPCDPVAECVKATVTCANVRIICKPGTECGMVDGKPTCVPIKCSEDEELKTCGTACEPSCQNPYPICTKQCVPNVCQCKDGLVRNDNGECVKEEDCKKECGVNQQFLQCGTACEPTCTNPRPTCSKQCVPNVCQCQRGFMRDQNGNCVSLKQCAQTISICAKTKCAANEVCQLKNVVCVKEPCDPVAECVPRAAVTCANARILCEPGTECGMVGGKPTCVPKSGITCANIRILCKAGERCGMITGKPTCVPICTENEVLGPCSNVCEKNCATRGMNLACRPDCSRGPQCACAEGFYRNPEGKCVTEDKCEKKASCSGENEEVKSCGTACEPSCQNPTPACTKQCVPDVCQCKKGFVRDENNKCIEQTQCSAGPTCSGENEEMKQCGTACEPSCENPTPTCTKQCVPNLCQCKKGFVRDENNKCIEQTQCPEPITPCATMRCKAGYVCVTRKVECKKEPCEMTAGCVLESCETKNCPEGSKCEEAEVKCPADVECPRPPPICVPDAGNTTKCGSFEELKKCGTACEPSCANIGKDVMCTKQCIVDVCQCQDGYVRDHNNRCIEEKECPKEPICSGDNEEMTQCGTACEPSCKNPSPICTKQCVPNLCQCKKGFVRDENNKCVKETECPKVSEECGLNEELRECGTACEPSCTNPKPTVCTEQCLVNVCQCKKGFVRDQETTKCVPLENCSGYSVLQCSTRECPEGSKCVKLEVQEPPRLGNEPRPPVGPVSVCDAEKCFPECVEGQVCKYKDNRDCPTLICARKMQCEPDVSLCNVVKCTAETECKVVETQCLTPPCPYQAKCVPKINNTTCISFEELKKCGTACEPSCANLGKDVICTKQCIVDVCQCQKGYVRDENKRCIPEKECPKEPTCGTNEEFLKCGSACQPTCENPNPICTKQCIPDVCQCKKGFVRDGEGKCVAQKECSAVTKECGSNEELRECGTACEPTCMNPRPKVCTEQCLINVCQCKKGFVRDPDTSNCVPLTECSGQASILCTDRKCPTGTACIQAVNSGSGKTPKIILPDGVTDLPIRFTKPVPSSLPTPSICTVPVMTCEKARLNCAKNETCGYDSGFPICVPVKKECGSNEEFRACGTACEPYCMMPERRTCTEKCVENVCQCEEGFMRDLLTKKCVLLEQCRMASMPCSQRKCPEGFFCVDAVSSPPMELPKGPILPGVTGQTIYVTDPPFGNPPSMCTEAPMKCPVNEEYVRCSGCPKNCGEEDKKCALVCGLPGCQCKDGYRRLLHNKMCVKEEDCNTLKG